jgi:hypothetical protein
MSEPNTRQRSYPATDETPQLLDELRTVFRLDSYSAVIRRPLALARIIAREADDNHTVVIQRKDGSMVQIVLDG